MKKMFLALFGFASLHFVAPSAYSQASPTAVQTGRIEAGVGYLYLRNDYTDRANEGLSVWGDYDFARFYHVQVGAEIELNFGGINAPDDIGENSYLVGPRLTFYRKHRFEVAGKALFGRSTISNQNYHTSSSFNTYAFGGTVDYHVKPKYNIRVSFEDQQWPDFEPHTLSPFLVSVGVLYVIR